MNNYKFNQLLISIFCGFLLVFGLLLILQGTPLPASAASSNLFVKPGAAGSCTQYNPCNLNDALSIANDNDTIYLYRGTYTGSGDAVITVTKSITIFGGWDGAASGLIVRDPNLYPTTIDGQNVRRGIYMKGKNLISPIAVTIDGIIVTGGNANTVSDTPGRGGGIYGLNITPILSSNILTNNIAGPAITDGLGQGGGVFLDNIAGSAVITGNHVISNAANTNGLGYGGGIFLASGINAQVANNQIISNTGSITGGTGFGGGITFMSSDSIKLTGNWIESNIAQGGTASYYGSYGGGIYCNGSDDAFIDDNQLTHNIASALVNGAGGAIALDDCDNAIITQNEIAANFGATGSSSSGGRGGGISSYDSQNVEIKSNKLLSNTAAINTGWGGAVYLTRNTSFTMTNNIIADNNATYQGGGLAFETVDSQAVTGTIINNTFVSNNSGTGMGRIAIYVNEPDVSLELINNIFSDHTYGVYVDSGSTVNLDHTLFYSNSVSDTGGAGTIINTNSITGQDPLLDDDCHLLTGSPAIDAGVTILWITTDIDGHFRPQGPAYDIGADEYLYRSIYLPFVTRSTP